MDRQPKTIVLIHGLWMTPRSWTLFRRFFEERGYHVLAPAWPRMEGEIEDIRRDPSVLAGLGVREIVDHYEQILGTMDEQPILVGHSFGGLIVQLLLDLGYGAAGVAINATVPRGIFRLPLSVIRTASPVLSDPRNYHRTVALTFEEFYCAFANTMTGSDARSAYEHLAVPGPGRPIFQALLANFLPNSATKVNHLDDARPPLLLLAGAADNLVPAVLNEINYRKYARSSAQTEYQEFPCRSHLMIAQEGWQDVADYTLYWIRSKTERGNPSVRESGRFGFRVDAAARDSDQEVPAFW
jgi:pimeloyl-ACP methyl ester carboxylesterase